MTAADADRNRAAADERTRISREMHESVAHDIAELSVYATAARSLLGARPDEAEEALGAVVAGTRRLVGRLNRIVQTLPQHHTRIGDSSDAPLPGLGQLNNLAEHVAAAGLLVDVTLPGGPGDLPARWGQLANSGVDSGVSLAVYRIVQQALMHALARAAVGTATVDVRRVGPTVEIDVIHGLRPDLTDDDVGGTWWVVASEWAAVYRGYVHTRTQADRIFQMHAVLRLE